VDDQARPGHVRYYFAGFVATSQQPPRPGNWLPTAPTLVQVRKRTPGLVLPRARFTNTQNSCSPDPLSHYEIYSKCWTVQDVKVETLNEGVCIETRTRQTACGDQDSRRRRSPLMHTPGRCGICGPHLTG
jgi:hypothetical protein